jgi:hypothetical protein
MERRFASIRDYIVARQQRRLDATAAIDDDNDIVVDVPTLPVEEDDVVVTASELSHEDMERLRSNDPWMYHSIVNKITGHTVCNFDRLQSEDGDAAAGRPSSINGNQTRSFRLAASNSTRARNDVHRQRRFSTEESTLPDPAWFNSTSLGAGDPVAAAHEFVLEGRLNQDGSSSLGAEEAVTAARPAVPVGRLNQDEDSNGSPLDLYLCTLFHLNFQDEEEDEVDELSAS